MKKIIAMFMAIILITTFCPAVGASSISETKQMTVGQLLQTVGLDSENSTVSIIEITVKEPTTENGRQIEKKYQAINVRSVYPVRENGTMELRTVDDCVVVLGNENGKTVVCEPKAGKTRTITDRYYDGYIFALYYGYEYTRYSPSGYYGHTYVPKAERLKVTTLSTEYRINEATVAGESVGYLTSRTTPDFTDPLVQFYSNKTWTYPRKGTQYAQSHTWPYGFSGASSAASNTGIFVTNDTVCFFRVGFDLEYENTLTGKTYSSEQEYRIE